jgi:hypothetical protein
MPFTGTRFPVAGISPATLALEATDVEAAEAEATGVEATERDASASLTAVPRQPDVDRMAGSKAAAMRAVRNIE